MALLAKRLDALIDDEIEAGLQDARAVQREFAAHGRFHSGKRILLEFEALTNVFKAALVKMAKLVYAALGDDPAASPMLKNAAVKMKERFSRQATNINAMDLEGRMNREFVEKLEGAVDNAVIEYGFGLAGGENLSKGKGGNVTNLNVIHNSPGATAAAAGGDVNQSVAQTIYANLIQGLDELLQSSSNSNQAIRQRFATSWKRLARRLRQRHLTPIRFPFPGIVWSMRLRQSVCHWLPTH
jgi:hypothetical protein